MESTTDADTQSSEAQKEQGWIMRNWWWLPIIITLIILLIGMYGIVLLL